MRPAPGDVGSEAGSAGRPGPCTPTVEVNTVVDASPAAGYGRIMSTVRARRLVVLVSLAAGLSVTQSKSTIFGQAIKFMG